MACREAEVYGAATACASPTLGRIWENLRRFPRIERRRMPSASRLRRDRQGPHRRHRPRPSWRRAAPDRSRQVDSARRNSRMPPCAARPDPGIENSRIRFDDPACVHRPRARRPEQSAIHQNTRRIGKFVGLLRPDARPHMATAPAKRPGHKVGAEMATTPGRRGHGNERVQGVDGAAQQAHSRPTNLCPASLGGGAIEPWRIPVTSDSLPHHDQLFWRNLVGPWFGQPRLSLALVSRCSVLEPLSSCQAFGLAFVVAGAG